MLIRSSTEPGAMEQGHMRLKDPFNNDPALSYTGYNNYQDLN